MERVQHSCLMVNAIRSYETIVEWMKKGMGFIAKLNASGVSVTHIDFHKKILSFIYTMGNFWLAPTECGRTTAEQVGQAPLWNDGRHPNS